MVLSKEEIVFAAREFYKERKFVPRIKDAKHLPFSRNMINTVFGTWSNMLRYADLPLNRNPPRLVECQNCKIKFIRQVKEIKKSKFQFCQSACNAQYYTTGRKHTEETKKKISDTLKSHYIFR
jgi:hypothetical protein